MFDGQPVPIAPGDSVAGALIAAGHLATSRSVKYRRPRGPSCMAGDCGTCLVRIDGRPNVRACLTRAEAGMRVDPQNRLLPARLDPSDALGDAVPEIDHHHLLLRPRLANETMQKVARSLAGLGVAPDGPPPPRPAPVRAAPDVLVVGAGAAGIAAAERLHQAGVDVLLAERAPFGAPRGSYHRPGLAVFAAYRADQVWAAAERVGRGDRLWLIRPRHVLLAVGAREGTLPLPRADLPGVLSARGLWRELRRSGRQPPEGTVLIGDGPRAEAMATRLAARLVPTAAVRALHGRLRVRAVELRDERIPCQRVALAGPLAPAHDLAVQAGAPVAFDGAGFAVTSPPETPCVRTPWSVWAAGSVRGATEPAAAAEDGLRVATAILSALSRGDAAPHHAKAQP